MTVKKTKQAIATGIILMLTILVLTLTFKTLCIGFDLASISEQNSRTETWRESAAGIVAANAVYEQNTAYRNAIYYSPNSYTRWISTTSKLTQLIVFISLISLSTLLFYIWYKYITIRIKNLRKRLMRKNYIRTTDKQLDN